jgi:TolA-binding protein
LLVEKVKAVAAKTEEDPSAAAQAEYLLGEYYAENAEYARAANTFINAASIHPEDKDLITLSLYRGLETLKRIGRNDEAIKLLERLQDNFPDSPWTLQAERLLEGN